jgi:site-specific DNA recombinase
LPSFDDSHRAAGASSLTAQVRASTAITPARLEAFAQLIKGKLESGDIYARKTYLRPIIEVDDDRVWVVGDKATLTAAIAERQVQSGNVRGFVRNWRARQDSNL